MEQNAKQLLKRISEKAGTLTDKKISQLSHAPKENEWRAYICQTKPHWEDIAWRVKEPNTRGEAEFHLGFYSAKPTVELAQAIARAEELAKGKVSHVIKNENGIRWVWKVNLNDENSLVKLFEDISNLMSSFLEIAFGVVIKSSPIADIVSISQDNQLPTVNNFESFTSWINNLTEEAVSENPEQYYQKICEAIWNLRDLNELDSDWTDIFESIINEEFYKNLESLKNGLDQWQSSLSSDDLVNLSSESGIDDLTFEETDYSGTKLPPIDLQKTWHNFLCWGKMWTGEHAPKHGKFVNIFNDKGTQIMIVNILLVKTREIIANTNL